MPLSLLIDPTTIHFGVSVMVLSVVMLIELVVLLLFVIFKVNEFIHVLVWCVLFSLGISLTLICYPTGRYNIRFYMHAPELMFSTEFILFSLPMRKYPFTSIHFVLSVHLFVISIILALVDILLFMTDETGLLLFMPYLLPCFATPLTLLCYESGRNITKPLRDFIRTAALQLFLILSFIPIGIGAKWIQTTHLHHIIETCFLHP